LRVVTAAYAGVSNIFGILAGKWRWAADASPPTEQDAKSLVYAADDYERALRTVGKAILTPEELRSTELGEISPAGSSPLT